MINTHSCLVEVSCQWGWSDHTTQCLESLQLGSQEWRLVSRTVPGLETPPVRCWGEEAVGGAVSQLWSQTGELQGHGRGEEGSGQGTVHECCSAHCWWSLCVSWHWSSVLHSSSICPVPEETRGTQLIKKIIDKTSVKNGHLQTQGNTLWNRPHLSKGRSDLKVVFKKRFSGVKKFFQVVWFPRVFLHVFHIMWKS